MFDLTGKTALVTGASGGIGAAIATTLHAQGASVVLHGTREERLAALKAELGGRVHIVTANLGDREAVANIIAEATEKAGPISILVNNAGINVRMALEQYPTDTFERILRANLVGPFVLARECAAGMKERGWGRILNVTN